MTGLTDLVQASGGLFRQVSYTLPACDEPQYFIGIGRSGDISKAWLESSLPHHTIGSDAFLNGAGADLSDARASLPALAEGLERYCTTLFDPHQFITATAEELGDEALDLDTIPVCSDAEAAHLDCPLRKPSKRVSIRWVKSVALLTGQVKYVPAVMVYLFLKLSSADEQICLPITSGCAAHRTFEDALLGALMELIERDALSLTWLQRLALPQLPLSDYAHDLGVDWEAYLDSSMHLECRLYDATFDLGIPTIYGVQRSFSDRCLVNIVSCASSLEPVLAAQKVLRDLVSTRTYLRPFKCIGDDWRMMTELPQSAVYMGGPSRSTAFDFLWETTSRRSLHQIVPRRTRSPKTSLCELLDRFRSAGMNVYAVDLSSDEAIRAGMRVVRVVVPELQPFSFNYRARYLGHKRLYSAPQKMGYTAYAEHELNPYPQPFA